jgi:hypothetical protein
MDFEKVFWRTTLAEDLLEEGFQNNQIHLPLSPAIQGTDIYFNLNQVVALLLKFKAEIILT